MDKTLNISITSQDWRGVALSNFLLSPFTLDGILFASIEGFIQGIKFPESDPRRDRAFVLHGWDAKNLGAEADRSGAYWQGERLEYGSARHHALIERAIRARVAQNAGLAQVLLSTVGSKLVHETGEAESPTTSLPATVFCRILEQVRHELQATGRVRAE
ncbi:MAG TPA: hypothetical protein VKZ66_09900 [Pusillimonas sp.]|jgi:predicted NAD-dependent protein-ADP-ribosyltransferase YbiA (DUF1768 family)|uniref:hypothetical protein n=1 Tax=unclassified Pusillimonas TaxID=2640016 RepID=UPI00261DD016|nr:MULTISPECIES: hypothetical protein [unclassified Pusillimonas]HLU20259.1 hypothetical protein [Pusillimonas sp.]